MEYMRVKTVIGPNPLEDCRIVDVDTGKILDNVVAIRVEASVDEPVSKVFLTLVDIPVEIMEMEAAIKMDTAELWAEAVRLKNLEREQAAKNAESNNEILETGTVVLDQPIT